MATALLGDTRGRHQRVSNAFLDGGALRTYCHRRTPARANLGRRATRCARRLAHSRCAADLPRRALDADVGLQRRALPRLAGHARAPARSYVMEHALQISFPAEFHGPGEAYAAPAYGGSTTSHASNCHPRIRAGIIHKTGAQKPRRPRSLLEYDRDRPHLRALTADHYEEAAADPCIDALRAKMTTSVATLQRDYLDLKRSIANAVSFPDGTARASKSNPHRPCRRRAEGIPLLVEKFEETSRKVVPQPRASDCSTTARAGSNPFPADLMAMRARA